MQQWTTQEAANVAVDELAGRAWEEDFDAIHHHQTAPHYRHSTAIQTILPDGLVSGNLAQTIPEAITTIRGKPKLQDTLRMTTEQMVLIDEEITVSNVRKFGKSSIARVQLSKQYAQQLYTEARVHRLNDSIPATCRCCDGGDDETILHILRYPSRREVHLEHNETFVRIMRDIEAPNHLLNLFEAGIEVALLDGNTHSGEDWNGSPNESTIDRTISKLLFDEIIPQQYKTAFKQ